ncbi:zinc finger protein basonuclin-2 [Gasterosteus aculeatus]
MAHGSAGVQTDNLRKTLAKLRLRARPPSSGGPVEVALPGPVLDLSSLVLYGAQAVPVRLKILLDRLYSVLSPQQVGHILHTLGWSLGDYVRGYMLQHPGGKPLDRWLTAPPEEELLILQQFLRFGETRPIVELMTPQCLAAVGHVSDLQPSSAPGGLRPDGDAVVERVAGPFGCARGDLRPVCRYEKISLADHKDTVGHFEDFPEVASLLLPLPFPNSAHLAPPIQELLPPSKLTRCLRRLSGAKPPERPEGGRAEGGGPISMVEPGSKVKADPEKPNTTDLQLAKQEDTSSISPSLSSPLAPSSSSSLHRSFSSSSSSPLRIPPKLHGSSSFAFKSLPSFSSSFLCPLPNASFPSSLRPLASSSSSLCPLPSSLCSLPSVSPAGVRKGRVCCGVCGKSFYDKGTLKIHYNAVHLKIKHRCTVPGCSMVFSSLRSRNRHSANPNPRLHAGADRDAHGAHKGGHVGVLWRQDEDARPNGSNGDADPRRGAPPRLRRTPSRDSEESLTSPGSPSSLAASVYETERCRRPLDPHADHAAPAHLPGPAPVTAGPRDVRPASRDEREEAHEANWQRRSGDSLPKKKPRKSSMPVKIARGGRDGGGKEEEDEHEGTFHWSTTL